jgi:DNA-binding GntR family transcriptional regulator
MAAHHAGINVTTVDVDPLSDVPPYQQIADDLRQQITSGARPPRGRLPSADSITQETGVAKVTARKALKVLVDEGYAVMRPGWGTFVAPASQWPAPR